MQEEQKQQIKEDFTETHDTIKAIATSLIVAGTHPLMIAAAMMSVAGRLYGIGVAKENLDESLADAFEIIKLEAKTANAAAQK